MKNYDSSEGVQTPGDDSPPAAFGLLRLRRLRTPTAGNPRSPRPGWAQRIPGSQAAEQSNRAKSQL